MSQIISLITCISLSLSFVNMIYAYFPPTCVFKSNTRGDSEQFHVQIAMPTVLVVTVLGSVEMERHMIKTY